MFKKLLQDYSELYPKTTCVSPAKSYKLDNYYNNAEK